MEQQALNPYFTTSILVALFLGAIAGHVISAITSDPISLQFFTSLSATVGNIFLSLLRMLLVPVVFVSLLHGISNMPGAYKLSAIGTLTIGLYLLTTAMAVSMGLFVTHFLHIGDGLAVTSAITEAVPPSLPELEVIVKHFFPSNIISAMADGELLQVLVFSALLGVAIIRTGKQAKPFSTLISSLHSVLISLVLMIMQVAPIGVFAITTSVVIDQGIGFIGSVAGYFFTVIMVLILQVFVVYGAMLRIWAKMSIFHFLRKISNAFIFAFSVSSSLASIPVVLTVAKQRLKISNETASFVIPLGATINMDGTAIMQGVATVFLSQVYGVHLSFEMYVVVVLLALLASVGTAGIPGAGLLTLSMVLHEVGIPLEGIVMIIGVDRLLDMLRTGVNITGDLAVAMLVDKQVTRDQSPTISSTHKNAATTSL
jgi:Na+/H+-dicarboxylate symporter